MLGTTPACQSDEETETQRGSSLVRARQAPESKGVISEGEGRVWDSPETQKLWSRDQCGATEAQT